MANDVAVEFHEHVGQQIIPGLHAAIFDRNQGALLLAQVLHGLIDVRFADGDLRLLDLQVGKVRQSDVRLHFNLKGIGQRPSSGSLTASLSSNSGSPMTDSLFFDRACS